MYSTNKLCLCTQFSRAVDKTLREAKEASRNKPSTIASEKRKEKRKAKTVQKTEKKKRQLEDKEEEKRFHGTPEAIPFGAVVDAPPDIEVWTAKLESIRRKLENKRTKLNE